MGKGMKNNIKEIMAAIIIGKEIEEYIATLKGKNTKSEIRTIINPIAALEVKIESRVLTSIDSS